MTEGLVHNQEEFLNNISARLGRERKQQVVKPVWKHRPQWEILKDAAPEELAAQFKKNSLEKTTAVIETTAAGLAETVRGAISQYGGGRVVTTKDARFGDYGLEPVLVESEAHVWNAELGEENIDIAKRAAVGVFFSDISLAESGTVVQFNGKDIARSVSLLPLAYLAIVPQSTIVPRMTQATHQIQQSVEAGQELSTCINFISGPSNSADIEMNIVIGVHGPVEALHVIVTDR
ncbi:lactate utilization protein C [Planococcus sp. ISL-109]|uniref:LutC/YkgG family protein n=1 Tax=Planococcus sp. ISL-109 TaxID=2819166 RepID=UPI001BE6C766|nr:lactate utilization protein C [Planococcus sp. ISL-109]MBT2582633.1 lactate utilization protein C [Planococcus sp. ISL-109]